MWPLEVFNVTPESAQEHGSWRRRREGPEDSLQLPRSSQPLTSSIHLRNQQHTCPLHPLHLYLQPPYTCTLRLRFLSSQNLFLWPPLALPPRPRPCVTHPSRLSSTLASRPACLSLSHSSAILSPFPESFIHRRLQVSVYKSERERGRPRKTSRWTRD